MKHLRFLLLAALVAMPLTGCDEDKKTVEPPVVGTVSGTVSVEGAGVAGVSVTLVGATSQSATTGAGGTYSFASVEAGTYGVAITDFPVGVSFSTVSKTTSITTAGQTATVDFSGSYIRTASVTGQVQADGAGLAAVAVTITGPEGAKNAVTDGAGTYSVSGLRAGQYTVAITTPAGYTFDNSSYAVSIGVGEAKVVSFFGQADVVIDPVTASVVIKSVTNSLTGATINPNAVAGQIDIAVQVDPGENDLQRVCVLLDGAEVENGCQTLGSAAAEEMLQAGVLEIVFTIFTNDFDGATGMPVYANDTYELSAVLDLENAQQSNVTTSMNLKFANLDTFIGTVTPEVSAIGSNGLLYYDDDLTVVVTPVEYSGKNVNSVTIRFSGSGVPVTYTDAAEPFSYTINLGAYQTAAGWLGLETIGVVAALYSDGTVASAPAVVFPTTLTGGATMTIDGVAPPSVPFSLSEQVSGALHPVCCSNNWVNPTYEFDLGLSVFADNANGVGGVVETFHMGAATLTQAAIAALPAVTTPGGTGLGPTMVNTEYEPVAVLTDLLGNRTLIGLTASAGGDNPLNVTVGHDAAPPTAQALAAGSQGDKVIFNLAAFGVDGVAGTGDDVIAGSFMNFSATEDRAGFSATPLRIWTKRQTGTATTYPVGANGTTGGYVNEGASVPACTGVAPVNGAPCVPNGTLATDAYYTVSGHLVDQAGNEVATDIVRYILKDETVPVTDNVALPPQLVAGSPATFQAPVSDNLDLWSVAFGFDFGDGVFIPFGENVAVGDGNRWDGAVVRSGTAVLTLANAVVARERASAAAAGIFAAAGGVNAPSGAFALATNVRAITEDAAGNLSLPLANNFIIGTVDAAGRAATFTAGPGTTATGAFDVVTPAAAENICNGQGGVACAVGDVTSQVITVEALGVSGVYPNPFGAGGKIYYYVHLNGVDGTFYTADDQWFLVGSIDSSTATFTDDGTVRTYGFSFTLTSAMVASIANGTNINVVAIGFNPATGTALVSEANTNLTVVNGS